MRPSCDQHRVPLHRVIRGGKPAWECPYSHQFRSQHTEKPLCRKCHRKPAYSEGLCYPCWYYR